QSTPDNSVKASHGTAVASIAAGETLGVAKGAQIVDVRGADCGGAVTAFRIEKILEWISSDPERYLGRAVINMSFNGLMNSYDYTELANDYALDNEVYVVSASAANGGYNIPVVSSAGNQGANVYYYWPGNANGSITVGGLSKGSDTIWQLPPELHVPP